MMKTMEGTFTADAILVRGIPKKEKGEKTDSAQKRV